jgi:GAF domain-containing protein
MMTNPYSYPVFASSLLLFLFGSFLLTRNFRSNLNRSFAFLSFTTGVWFFSYTFMYNVNDPSLAHFFAKLGYTGIILIPTFLYAFTAEFSKTPSYKKWFPITVLAAAGFIILNYLNLFITGVYRFYWGYYPKGGFFLLLFILYFCVVFLLSISVFYRSYQRKSIDSNKARYLVLAFVLAILGCVDYFGNFGFEIYPLGYVFATSCIAVVLLAIVRHRLMDIEVVIKKGIVYATLTAILTLFYFAAVYLSEVIFRGLTGYSTPWIILPAIVALAVLFQPMRERVQRVVDSTFFRSRYDYQRILARYSHALRKPATDLGRFLKLAPYLVCKNMKLRGAGVLVLNRAMRRYEMRTGECDHKKLINMTISDNFELIKEMSETGQMLVADEVDQKLSSAELTYEERNRYEALRREMKKMEGALFIPSVSKSEYFKSPTLLAVFVFGGKLSDDSFSREDILFLEAMARQASITIEYAFILEELKRDEEKIIQTEKFAALGTMAGSVVGALRLPIEDMEKYSKSMSENFGSPEFRDGFVSDMPRDIMRLDRVVNDLLVYARPMKLNSTSVKLNSLVEKAVDLLRVKEAREHVEVKSGLADLPEIQADSQHLLNAIVRILSYAVAAASKEIYVATGSEGRHVFLSVAIPGAVIPRDVLDKIFASYYSPKEGEGGLELATAAKIVKEHGGDVKVASDQATGTKFVVSLPVEKAVFEEIKK